MSLKITKVKENLRVVHQKTLEEIEKYVCCGGNAESGKMPYFLHVFGGRISPPSPEVECVCGHSIVRNFYIRNSEQPLDEVQTKDLLVVGSCCVNQFTRTGTKQTCSYCHEPTKRRKSTVCLDCVAMGVCEQCGVKTGNLWKNACNTCNRSKKASRHGKQPHLSRGDHLRPPSWLELSSIMTPHQLCLQWEGQRLVTCTHLLLFKYLELTPPWEKLMPLVYYVQYTLPADSDERELLIQSVDAYPHLSWKPFVVVSDSNITRVPFVIRRVQTTWQLMEGNKCEVENKFADLFVITKGCHQCNYTRYSGDGDACWFCK